jgi:hypothetical protein
MKTIIVLALALQLSAVALAQTISTSASSAAPQITDVRSGELHLKGYFWKPAGSGPFPAILFNHGSGRSQVNCLRRQQSDDDSMLGGHGASTPLEHGCQGLLVVFCRAEVLQTSQVDCIRKDRLEFAYQMSFDRGPCWERVHGVTS